MAIAPTGNIFKGFVFDGESSKNYGIYITGEAVYNAPERDVEMITIPGRSGQFALDNGRFENIEVTYPAGIFANDETSFAEAVSDFRNILCSRKGYVRLMDEYNPNEYRLAVYKSGLEVSPAQLKAGEFEITFDCKPQRWLISGENEITVTDGDTITNPTSFDSSPLLTFAGYGTISFAGQSVSIENKEIGDVIVSGAITNTSASFTVSLNLESLNTGDEITLSGLRTRWAMAKQGGLVLVGSRVESASNAGGTTSVSRDLMECDLRLNDFVFNKGTTSSITGQLQVSTIDSGANTDTFTFNVVVSYSSSNDRITIATSATNTSGTFSLRGRRTEIPEVHAYSTMSALVGANYIDLDIGEAWNENGGTITSLNNIVQLPAKLPVLKAGENIISFDNTLTSLKITPRWWKV